MPAASLAGIVVLAALVALTVAVSRSARFSGLTFTSAVATCVAAALIFPHLFISVGDYRLTRLIVWRHAHVCLCSSAGRCPAACPTVGSWRSIPHVLVP